MQSKHVERMVRYKKRICHLLKRDRGISDELGDVFMFYKPMIIVIGRIGNEVPMSSNLA